MKRRLSMIPIGVWIIFLVAGVGSLLPAAHAISLPITAGSGEFHAQVKSMQALKFKHMVRQTQEFSCGAAALATILTYHFGRNSSEEEVLAEIIRAGNPERVQKIEKMGVSLLDLKKTGEAFGYKGTGYRLPDHLLKKIDRPAILLINTRGFAHFIVLKAIRDEKVYIADPAKGNQVMDFKDFRKGWGGILLMFEDPGGKPKGSRLLTPPESPLNKLSLTGQTVTDVVRYMVTPNEFN